MLPQEWNIQSRAPACAVSGTPFVKGERVYSALYWRDGQYARVDMNAAAWEARNENIAPVSAWQADFVPPPPAEPEALGKNDAESLLRRLLAENEPGGRNARYILALMLERKKILRQVEKQRQEGGATLVYEHIPTGEVWLIDDPGLKLGELKTVQDEVAGLLARADQASAPVAAETAPTIPAEENSQPVQAEAEA